MTVSAGLALRRVSRDTEDQRPTEPRAARLSKPDESASSPQFVSFRTFSVLASTLFVSGCIVFAVTSSSSTPAHAASHSLRRSLQTGGACAPQFTKKWSATACPASASDCEGYAEIVKYDKHTGTVFVTTADIGIAMFDAETGASRGTITGVTDATSLDSFGTTLVVASVGATKSDKGIATFYTILPGPSYGATHLQTVPVGYHPDMVTFTPDGKKVVIANEGEPNDDYTFDPVGSVSIIDVATYAHTEATFDAYTAADVPCRIFGPGASVAQDLEPEFVVITPDSKTAIVAMQENNCFAVIDIPTAAVKSLHSAGEKDWSTTFLDPSNKDGDDLMQLVKGPAKSFNMPDALASFTIAGETYFAAANEGDARDYDGFSEEERGDDLTLAASIFPAPGGGTRRNGDVINGYASASAFQKDENFGRLKVTTANGDADGDGTYDTMWGYGGRSFSIFKATTCEMVSDDVELVTQMYRDMPERWQDGRADDKGPEPEGIVAGKVNGNQILFVAMERTSDIGVFDVTDPSNPKPAGPPSEYILYGNGDTSPEGMDFISAADSPSDKPMLAVAYEVSGTVAMYEAQATCAPAACADWCNEWTRSEAACQYCEIYNAPRCADYCNAHICGNVHCTHCDVCHAVRTDSRCAPWCNAHINEYMPASMCGGC